MNKKTIIGVVLGFLLGGLATYLWCPRIDDSNGYNKDLVNLYQDQKISYNDIVNLLNYIEEQNEVKDSDKTILTSTSWDQAKTMVEKYQATDIIHLFELLNGEPQRKDSESPWIQERVSSWVITMEDIQEMLKAVDDGDSKLTMNGIRVFMAKNYHKPSDKYYNTLAMVPVSREIYVTTDLRGDTVYNNIKDSKLNSSQPNGVAYEYVRPCPKYCNGNANRQIGENK